MSAHFENNLSEPPIKIKTFRERWDEKDWAKPIVSLLHNAFLLFLDALQIGALFAIATGLDTLLEHLKVKPFKLESYHVEVEASEIIKNFDYMLLCMFLFALIYRFWKILRTE